MTDTERLDLIEHYQWDILSYNKEWIICGEFGKTGRFKSLREAIEAATAAQIKWSTS